MKEHSDPFLKAKNFLFSNARLIERCVFSILFGSEKPDRILRAVAAYRNSDGGLGHALEPDIRCSESQPLFVEIGLSILHECGIIDTGFARSVCDFLESVAEKNGLVRPILQGALAAPHADHWNESSIAEGLNPTIGICGLLHYQKVSHPWLEKATSACTESVFRNPPDEAHTLLGATRLADHHPDGETRGRLFAIIAEKLPQSQFFIPYAPVRSYGLTPLHFAQSPDSHWRSLFTNEQIEGHLDDLAGKQQEDGGWPISWRAPGPASVAEWRGRWTLDAIKVLVNYGRMKPRG